MTPRRNSIASMTAICLLTMPLTGCAGGLVGFLRLVAGAETKTVVAVQCPQLDDPNAEAIDALEADARLHPETGRWAVKLEKHLEKLDSCREDGGDDH